MYFYVLISVISVASSCSLHLLYKQKNPQQHLLT